MSERVARREEDSVRPDVVVPQPQQPSPFAQQRGPEIGIDASFQIANRATLDQKTRMLDVELSGPMSRDDTQYHRRRMSGEYVRAERSGDTELSRRWEITSAIMRVADNKMGEAEDARSRGDTARARELEGQARQYYDRALRQEVILEQQRAGSARFGDEGPPREIDRAQWQVWYRGDENSIKYQQSLDQAGNAYVAMRPAFDSSDPRARGAKEDLLAHITNLGTSAQYGIAYERATAQRYREPVAEVQNFTEMIFGAGKLAEQLAKMDGIGKDLKKMLEDMDEELGKLKKKLEDGKATKEDIEKAKEISEFVNDSGIVLEGVDAKSRPAVSRMLARGAAALLKGKRSEAFAQRQLAREYLTDDPEYRKKIEQLSEKLANGEITAGAAIKEMRAFREKMLADFDKKPITEKSASAFAARLEAFIKTRKLDKELEEGKPAFKKELEDVRAIYKKAIALADKAEMARKAGLNKEAKEYEAQARALLKEADTKVAVLEYAQKLKEAKAPKEMVEAVRSAFSMIGTENDWRGRMAIKAANFFLNNSRFFNSGAGKKVLGAVSGFMSWLTDPKNKIDQEEANKKYSSIDAASRQTMSLGPDLEKAERKLKGGPEGLLKAVNGVKSFVGTDQQWRVDFVLKAVQFYLDNRNKFKGANGEAMLKRLLAFVSMVADPEQKLSADQQKESETYLEKMKKELGRPEPKAEARKEPDRVEGKPVQAKPAGKPVKFAGLIKLRGERAGAPTAAPKAGAKIERSADDQARLDKLKELKVPEEIIKTVEAAYSDPDPVRRKAVIEAAELYLKYSRFFDAPALAEAKTAIFDFMKSLSASIKEGTLTEEGGRIVNERLGRFTQFMEGAKEEERKNKVAILDTSIVQLGDELARATDPAYKDALQKAIDQAKALRDKLNDPKTADLVTEQEIKSLSAGLTMIDSAKRVLDSIEDPKVRKEVEKILGRSLAAGAAGKSEEAEFQFFLARQYLGADKAYRKVLASGSEKLEKEPGTLGALKAEIGKYVAGLVEKEAQKIKDKDQQQKFLDYAKSVRDAGESITIDDISRGYFASKMAREYAEIEKEAARKPKLRDGALAITQRGLDSLVAKDDMFIVAQQFEYSRSYLDADQKGRDEYEKLSLRLQDLAIGLKNGTLTLESPDVKKTLSYAAAYKDMETKASLLRKEMKNNTRNGTMERRLYERGIAKLEEFKSRLASGEEITPDYEKAVAMYLGFFSFKPSEVLAQYYYSRGIDPREKMDEISRLEGLSKPSYNFSKLGQFDRANLTVMYGYAMDALDKGDFRSYEIYMKYAQGAASVDKKTREMAVLDANNFGMGTVSIDDAQWKAGALHDKVNMERSIKGNRDRDRLDSYFYTVMKAYESGDRNGAAAGKDMLALYTDAILGDKKLGKESLAHVEKYLGKDGLLNKAMKEGRTLAEQLAVERGIEKPTADQSVSILAGVQEDTAKMSITLSKDRFDKEAETLRGQNEREQRRKGAAYRKENERLMGEARRARKKDEKKADGLEAAAALSDYSAFTKAIDEAKELSQKGHDLLVQAQALRKKAMEEPGKREEYEKQAVELENQGKFLIQQSGDMLEGLKQFDRSMIKIWYGRGANFQTTKAESGRAELWAGITGMSEISKQFLADPKIVQSEDARKKYQFAQQSLQAGYQLVENQFSLQKEAWQRLETAKRLEKSNKELSDKGAGQIVWEGEGGFKHVYYESWDYYVQVKYYGKEEDGIWIPMKESEPGGTYREETEVRRGGATMQEVFTQDPNSQWRRENRVIHSHADNSWDLDKARNRIYGGDLRGADRKLQEVSGRLNWTAVAMQVVNFKGQVSSSNDYTRKFKYYDYWFARDPSDRSIALDASTGYVGRLDSAWDDINKGYFDRASGKIKAVENDSFVGMARQDMFNKASNLRDSAQALDGFISTLKNFNPLGTKKTDLKGGSKEDYDEVVAWVKTHKVTVTDTVTGQNIQINPMDAMMQDVRNQQTALNAKADLIEGELMKIKTADEVRLGMMIVRTNDKETLANTENVKEYTAKWIEEGKKTGPRPFGTFAITEDSYKVWMKEQEKPEAERNLGQGQLAISEGTAAYVLANSHLESGIADFERHKMGWDLSVKSYTEGVMNTLSGAPMARSVKFRHYKATALNSYTAFLQMGDGFALNPGDAEYGVKNHLFVPEISGKFADVEFTRSADEGLSVPLTMRYAYLGHFKDLLKLSGENALGYTGQHLQDPMSEYGGNYLETVSMAAWGFGKNPNTGRYERLKLNEKEQEVMNRYIEDFISMKQEVFGDALKMHEYWISDKTGEYFKKKIEGMMSYNKGLGVLVNAPYMREDKGYVKELYRVRREAWFEWKNETDPDRKERRWKDYQRLDNQVDKATRAAEWAKSQREYASDRGRTKSIMDDAAHKEQWAGPIKVVVYGAAIYFTGGLGAIAIGGMSTVEATVSYSDQIQWAGGEHNLTFKEKAMGYGGIALGMLSTVAPMLGEVGLMARAPRLAASMNYTLIGGGIVMAIPQVFDMYKMYEKGEMTGIGFAANVLTAAQPALQIGVHGLHPKPFANKYLRFASGILFGTPASDKIPDLVLNEMYAVEHRKMAEYSPANVDNLALVQTKVGGMSVNESLTVMKLFEGKAIDVNYASDLVNNYRNSIRHDQAKTISAQKIKTFDEYARDYARAIPPPDIKVRASGEGGTSIVVKGQVKVEEAPIRAPAEPEVKIEVDLSKGSTKLETELTQRKQKLVDNEQWGRDEIELFERVARELEYYRNVPDSQVPEHYKRWVKEPGAIVDLAETFIRNNGGFEGDAGPSAKINKPFAFGKFMTEGEFTALHPQETVLPDGSAVVTKPDGTQVKVYHNKEHTANVAQTAHDLALKMPFTKADEAIFGSEASGGKQNKADFLMQVGILHDADPMRTPGKPARASATIEWMDSPDALRLMKEKFGWDPSTADGKRKIDMAKAIIQRTEFPFDMAKTGEKTTLGFPRGKVPTYEGDAVLNQGAGERIGTRYDKMSPQEHYEKMLGEMDADSRAFVLKEAAILSEYADKSSWYFGKPKGAYDSVIGLGTEAGMDMMAGTSGFLKSIGQGGSFKADVEIAKKFGIDAEYPVIDKVLELLGPDAVRNWEATKGIFENISKGGNDAKAQAKAAGLDEDAQKKVASRAVELAAEREKLKLENEEYPASNRRKTLAMEDPPGFAVAEHVLDKALMAGGMDPKAVRSDPVYAEYISRIMREGDAGKEFAAQGFAKELPQAMERGKLDGELAGRGISGPIADDARLIMKAARGQDMTSGEQRKILNLPEDLSPRMSKDMTFNDIIDVAHELHRRELSEGALKVASELAKTKGLDDPARTAAADKTRTYVEAYDQIARGVPEQEIITKLGVTKAEVDYLRMQVGLDVHELAGNFALLAIRPDMLQVHQTGENIGTLSKLAVTGNPDTYSQAVITALEGIYGGRSKIPPELIPEKGTTLHDTVKNSAPALKKILEGIRRDIGFEENIFEGFLKLDASVKKGQEVADALGQNQRVNKEPQEIGVIVLDGAKTWMKNGLGYGGENWQVHDRAYNGFEVGDLGLIIYMEAAKRFARDNPEIYTKLQTAEGDEVIAVIPRERLGSDPQKAIAEYELKFRQTLETVALEMGISKDSPLFAALADVNAHGGVVGIKSGEGGAKKFSYGGKEYGDLNGALVGLEVGHSLDSLAKREGGKEAAKRIDGFITDMLGTKPESSLSQLRIERQAAAENGKEIHVDAYATFRIGLESGMRADVQRLAENNGKGVTHVENGLAGPSVVNQMGHPVTDSLSRHFQDALAQSFKKHGIADKVEIYADGPMTFAFRFKGSLDMDTFHAAVKDAGDSFPKLMRDRGVDKITKATVASTEVEAPAAITGTVREVKNGVVTIRDMTVAEKRVQAEKKARDRMKAPIIGEMFQYRAAARGADQRVAALISDAHLFYKVDGNKVVPAYSETSVLRDAFTDGSGRLIIDESVMAALEKVAAKKWIRTPEDLINHFRESKVSEENIEGFFKVLGFERISEAKADLGGKNVGAVFRRGDEKADQVVLEAGGGEVAAPVPPKPQPAPMGADAVKTYKLDTPDGFAEFARKIALGDKDATAAFENLPVAAKKIVNEMAGDPAFARIAKSDYLFKSYIEDTTGHGRKLLTEYSEKIGKLVTPAVAGEVVQRPQEAKPVAEEPRVVVADSHAILETVSSTKPKKLAEAYESFTKLSVKDQEGVISGLREQARAKAEEATRLDDQSKPTSAEDARDHAAKLEKRATFLTELSALSGETGKNLETAYGLKSGELSQIYREGHTLDFAREKVAQRLGITADVNDGFIFGMLLSGNLAGLLKEIHPNAAKIEMSVVGKGGTGAYMVKVTDADGTVHTEFVKKVDMRPDAAGAENLRLSGVPAPQVITTTKSGIPLSYVQPDGKISPYGITRSIGDFNGTLKLAGKEISLTTDSAVSLYDMVNSPALMDIFINNPKEFWKQLGYMNAAGYAVGAVDAHPGNVYGMIMTLKDPRPADITALKDAGYHVWESDGKTKMFMLGRIDTDDSSGTYRASGEKGNFDFSSYRDWMGKDSIFPKVITHLTRVRNEHEASGSRWRFELPPDKLQLANDKLWPIRQGADGNYYLETGDRRKVTQFENEGLKMISAPAKEPQFITADQLVKEGFGSGGGFYEGVKGWAKQHIGNQEYENAIRDGFRRREGEPAGVSSLSLSRDEEQKRQTSGVGHHNYPANGEAAALAFSGDNRTVLFADYETVDLKKANTDVSKHFPENKTVFVAPVTEKQARGSEGAFKVGDKWFLVYPDEASVPADLKGKAMGVMQNRDVLRAPPGFGEMTGIETKKLGAVHVFDYIMGLKDKGLMKEFMKLEEMYLDWEKGQVKVFKENPIGGALVFWQRMPPDFAFDAYFAAGDRGAPPQVTPYTKPAEAGKPAQGAKPSNPDAPTAKAPGVEAPKPTTEENIGVKSMALRDAKAELDRIKASSPDDKGSIAKAQTKYDDALKELGALMPNESITEVERKGLGLEKKFTKEQDAAAKELAGNVQLANLAEGVINGDKEALRTMALLADHPVRKIVEQLAADTRFREALSRKDGSDIDIANNYTKEIERTFLEMKQRAARDQETPKAEAPSNELVTKAAQGDAEARKDLAERYSNMKEPKTDMDALVLGEIERRVAAGKSRKDAAEQVVEELLGDAAKVSYNLGLDQSALDAKGPIASWTVDMARSRADQNGRPAPNAEDIMFASALKRALGNAIEGEDAVRLLGKQGAEDLRKLFSGKEAGVEMPRGADLIFLGVERMADVPQEKLPQAIDAYMRALADAKTKFGKIQDSDNFGYAFDHGITHLVENASPDKVPDLLARYTETAAKLTEKIKLGAYHSSTEEEASARVFEIAAVFHINGVKDPMALLSNGSKSGIVDLFLSSPESFRGFPQIADDIVGLIAKMPDGVKFKVQKKGKDAKLETVEVSRGQIIETTLPWLFGDMTKIADDGNRERYFNIFKANFEWHSPDAYRLAEKLAKDPSALLELASGLARGERDAKERLRTLGNHPVVLIVETAADAITLKARESKPGTEPLTKADTDAISFDAKPYSKLIKEGLHPQTFQEQYGKLLADSVKSGKPIEKNELPILIYAMKDPQGVFPADAFSLALENDFFKKKMENRAVFDSVAGLLIDADLALKESSRGARSWLSMVEDNLMYLLVEETSSAKKPPALIKEMLKSETDPQKKKALEDRLEDYIQKRKAEKLKDSREDFASSKVQHLRNIWNSRNAIGQRGLMEMADGMKGHVGKSDFAATLGSRYVELYSSEAKFSEDQKKDISKFAIENPELFLQIYAYRKNISRFTDPSNIPKDYKGKPESFKVALEVLDKALLAQARGEFAQFKFSDEFRNELIKKYGKSKGAAIFDQWSTEVPVLVENSKYQIYETGKFEEGFNCGIVKGATACQSPSNPMFFASSVVGSMELPWIKQVAVKVPGEPDAIYRRWLMLVNSDKGKPVLLVQQEYYSAASFPEGAAIDKQIISALKKRYEPLGIEVRPVKANNKEDRNQKNYGYGTFESGRSPFFYIDSNMYSMGHEDTAWHGHHERTPGKSVDFGKGWSKDHIIKTEVP